MSYTVYVDDNYHYMDESERYKLGSFSTCQEALDACKDIVDAFLYDTYKQGMTADELYQSYVAFGEDPFIASDDETCKFSAWTYAKLRSQAIVVESE